MGPPGSAVVYGLEEDQAVYLQPETNKAPIHIEISSHSGFESDHRQAGDAFDRNEAHDFLSMRWMVAQRGEPPSVHVKLQALFVGL